MTVTATTTPMVLSMSMMGGQQQQRQQLNATALVLHKQFPKSTLNECKRFLHACGINDNDEAAGGGSATTTSTTTFGSRFKNKKKSHPHGNVAADSNTVQKQQEKEKYETAETMLRSYLDWRTKYDLDNDDDQNANNMLSSSSTTNGDALNWEYAVSKAIRYNDTANAANKPGEAAEQDSYSNLDEGEVDITSETESSVSTSTSTSSSSSSLRAIPQWVFLHRKENIDGNDDSGDVYFRDRRCKRILHVLPAKIDKSIISDINIHALAVAFYLDRIFMKDQTRDDSVGDGTDNEDNDSTVTLYIDTRPGDGWPNPIVITMISLISKIIHILQSYYPGRLETVIVFPIPYVALYVWNTIKPFLFQKTLEKIVIIPGSANVNSTVNEKKKQQFIVPYIDDEIVIQLEKNRLSLFHK